MHRQEKRSPWRKYKVMRSERWSDKVAAVLMMASSFFFVYFLWGAVNLPAVDNDRRGADEVMDDTGSPHSLLGSSKGSTLDRFWNVYEQITQPQPRTLILLCATPGSCGGIADRARAIPFAMSLALLGRRQLIVDASLLTNVPEPKTMGAAAKYEEDHSSSSSSSSSPFFFKHHFHFNTVPLCITSPLQKELLVKYYMDHSPTVFLSTNCSYPHPWEESRLESEDEQITSQIREIEQSCGIPHLCGAAVLRRSPTFAANIAQAQELVEQFSILQYRNYTALHVRSGGSYIRAAGSHYLKAVPWDDGYASDIPQLWLDAFAESTFAHCTTPLLVVSDSDRVVSELRFVAANRIPIVHCCSQPLHRDLPETTGFFFQEILDLFFMARARTVVGGLGGFLTLAQKWLGDDGPMTRRATTRDEIRAETRRILHDSGCVNVMVPS